MKNKIANNFNYQRTISVAFASFCLFIFVDQFRRETPEYPTIEQLVESNNYRLINHTIMTEDGYFLSLRRVVPKDFDANRLGDRKPVLLLPGMFASGNIFLFKPPNTTPGLDDGCSNIVFCLLKTGRYDVWMTYLRGELSASDTHINMTKNDPKFWDYSIEEMAIYDLPASIDYIKQHTRSRHKIALLGYSMGGTIQGIFMTMKPEYSSQIHPYVAWSPGVVFDNFKVMNLVPLHYIPKMLLSFPWPSVGRFLMNLLDRPLRKYVLSYAPYGLLSTYVGIVAGESAKLNNSHLPYMWNLANPSGEKSRVLEHFQSIVINRKFVQFNANRHLSTFYDPPESFQEYPWKNIPSNLTMLVMYGDSDIVVTPMDVKKFVTILQDHGVNAIPYRIKSKYWNHFNFVIASDVSPLVNVPTVKFLDQHY